MFICLFFIHLYLSIYLSDQAKYLLDSLLKRTDDDNVELLNYIFSVKLLFYWSRLLYKYNYSIFILLRHGPGGEDINSSLFAHNPSIPKMIPQDFEPTKESVFSLKTFDQLSIEPR